MKLMKLFNLVITISVMLMMLAACETDEPGVCPDLQISVNVNDDSSAYIIKADFEGIEGLIYDWYVNDDLIETEEHNEKRNNKLDFHFSPGTYTICIKAESPNCEDSLQFCTKVIIKDHEGGDDKNCPTLRFEKTKIEGEAYKYLFEAAFPERENLFYVWYVDGDSVESEPLDGERFHKFDYTFEPGSHTVCIKAHTDLCGELKYCKEFIVEEWSSTCVVPEFTADPDGPFAYTFTAHFEGKETTQYKWYVEGELVDKENFDGIVTDHQLYWQFDAGKHHICIETIGTDHCPAKEFCKEIIIGDDSTETGCPALSFGYDHTGNEYVFTANFEGMNELSYSWFINDTFIEDENPTTGKDNKLTKSLEPGTYDVCILTETPDCPQGTSFCKRIVIEEQNCVSVSYTSEATNDGYLLTADFDQRDNVTYKWKVFINDDFQYEVIRHAGSDTEHTFALDSMESGVSYEVCLKQDGDCPNSMSCTLFSVD